MAPSAIFKKAGLLIGMWLIPGPILIPLAVYFYYKWRKQKDRSRPQNPSGPDE
jgi:hypothetical protein